MVMKNSDYKKLKPIIDKKENFKLKLLKDWFYYLEDVVESKYFDKLLDFIQKSYKIKEIYPKNKANIFNIFRKIPFRKVRVVILTNGNYDNNKNIGTPFANNETPFIKNFSPELLKIISCVERKVKDNLYLGFDPTFNEWIDQGVLLLNTSLTCEKGDINSHTKYWKIFISKILKRLSDYNNGIIFCLWGTQSFVYEKYINKETSYIMKYYHPSLSVKLNRKWNCNHFNKINNIIKSNNGEKYQIQW